MCDSYSGLSLLSTTYKIVTYYKERLETIAEEVTGEYRAGFRKGKNITYQMFTMKEISGKC
jgi:hypothetical protein